MLCFLVLIYLAISMALFRVPHQQSPPTINLLPIQLISSGVDKLSTITCGTSSVTEFLITIKTLADELTALGSPPSDEDLLLYSTRGLGPAYKEVIAAL
ncbi:hypothetical protein L484_024390 [Morus notabilis]|uniref:Uncharacterized protein n=1 Tax=Morus notabilis TaxID=981085 RepID=W9S7R1_9ROSA|nr:hypothetical protein L484_024390 [Morus notabilis]